MENVDFNKMYIFARKTPECVCTCTVLWWKYLFFAPLWEMWNVLSDQLKLHRCKFLPFQHRLDAALWTFSSLYQSVDCNLLSTLRLLDLFHSLLLWTFVFWTWVIFRPRDLGSKAVSSPLSLQFLWTPDPTPAPNYCPPVNQMLRMRDVITWCCAASTLKSALVPVVRAASGWNLWVCVTAMCN